VTSRLTVEAARTRCLAISRIDEPEAIFRTTIAVAMGESVANMLQPFFALPLLAIAGAQMRRMYR
jgi:short subunit fatty acids transporter